MLFIFTGGGGGGRMTGEGDDIGRKIPGGKRPAGGRGGGEGDDRGEITCVCVCVCVMPR